ncbi:MAG: Fe-S-containing hydro-lyase [Clostridiales bacterium]|nr:Fe-S-containing hydro-lyase [Clostridiales bacterium]
MIKKIQLPITDKDIEGLKAGDAVLLSGKLLTGRDAAHKRIVEAIKSGNLPFDIDGMAIYYVGPCPAKEGSVIGSCGPTTSYRMDPYAPTLMDNGLKAMIGKGGRSKEVVEAIVRNKCVYFAAIGGAGAMYSKQVKAAKVIAYDDLGTEAVRELMVEDFPVIVAIDSKGNCVYEK